MINATIVLFGLTMLYTAATSRLEAYIKNAVTAGFSPVSAYCARG